LSVLDGSCHGQRPNFRRLCVHRSRPGASHYLRCIAAVHLLSTPMAVLPMAMVAVLTHSSLRDASGTFWLRKTWRQGSPSIPRPPHPLTLEATSLSRQWILLTRKMTHRTKTRATRTSPTRRKLGLSKPRPREGPHRGEAPEDKKPFRIMNIVFKARPGEFICVIGRVGSGKTALMQSLIGEMRPLKGKVVLGASPSYVPQRPWIRTALSKSRYCSVKQRRPTG